MDFQREHPGEYDSAPAAPEASPASSASVADAIGSDERRMHVRAYNYWASLLDGRDYPSIEDLDPARVEDFAANSVLLDFTEGRDNPATPYVGTAIRAECDLADTIRTIADVPSRSLLSRLTDHYLQIIANRAPIGFEAEFVNQRGSTICYRGILMPFSSDGDTIDFIYGVINWKQDAEQLSAADAVIVPVVEAPVERAILEVAEPEPHPAWEDGPLADEPETLPELVLDETAGLADRLWAARESAEAVKAADGRSRAALYRALASAYDFAIAADDCPEDYAELLEDSGLKAQARAPMTPIAKLVFGIDTDKARLTEFAAALSYARRSEVAAGGFLAFIEGQAGGLKALVAAERQARRPDSKPASTNDKARARLRQAPAIQLDDLAAEGEFSLVLVRRRIGGGGGHDAVALIDDPALVERAIRKAG